MAIYRISKKRLPFAPLILVAVALHLLPLSSCKAPAPVVFFHPGSTDAAASCPMAGPGRFQEAFLSLDFEAAQSLARSHAERQLLGYAGAVTLSPAISDRETFLIPEDGGDSLVLHQWAVVDQANAWLRDDFEAAAKGEDPATAALSGAFAALPHKQWLSYGRDSFQVQLHHSSTNSPLVDVVVNGKPYRFWLDSGAGVSVVSSEVAKDAGIRSLSDGGYDLNTSTKHVVIAGPASIDSLRLGALRVYNHPCVVLDKKDLTFRLLGIRLLKIDGIIGWPLLKQLDIEFDLPGEILTLRRPVPLAGAAPNLGWFWQPFLQCPTANGCLLNLQIDTGSSSTFFHPSSYPKLSQSPRVKGKSMRGGAGGKEVVSYDRLDSCRFSLGTQQVTLAMAEGIANNDAAEELFIFDGVLGQDILARGVFRMDFVNRRYLFRAVEP